MGNVSDKMNYHFKIESWHCSLRQNFLHMSRSFWCFELEWFSSTFKFKSPTQKSSRQWNQPTEDGLIQKKGILTVFLVQRDLDQSAVVNWPQKFAVPCGLTGCVLIPWSHNLGHRTPVFSGWTLPYGDSNLWVVFSTSHALHHAQGLCSVARRGCVGWATQTFLLHCFIQLESHYPQVSLLSFWFSFYYYYTGHIFYFTLPL